MLKTLVVIPCYNEADRLRVGDFARYVDSQPDLGFLFVNDGSTDATLPIIQQLSDSNPSRISVLNLPENRGKATAVQKGIAHAIKRRPEYVGFWDADLATPLDEIGKFTKVLDQRPDLQIVIGSRIALLGRKIQRTRVRRILGRLFAFAATSVLSLRVCDTQCGAKMFRVNSEIDSIFAKPFYTKWILDVEILARLIAARRQTGRCPAEHVIYEQPLESWQDVAGSKLKSFDFVKAGFELAVIYWRCLGPFRQPVATETSQLEPTVGESNEINTPSEDSHADIIPFPTSGAIESRKAA